MDERRREVLTELKMPRGPLDTRRTRALDIAITVTCLLAAAAILAVAWWLT